MDQRVEEKKRKKEKPGIWENTVRKIIQKYYKEKHKIQLVPTRGAGPDFIHNGYAIEIKGVGAKGSRFNRAISQYINYALKFRGLEIAFPIDILNAENLIRLDILFRVLWEIKGIKIKTYLITNYKYDYFVKEFEDGKDILSGVLSYFSQSAASSHYKGEPARADAQKTMNRIEQLVKPADELISFAMQDIILTKADIAINIYDPEITTGI